MNTLRLLENQHKMRNGAQWLAESESPDRVGLGLTNEWLETEIMRKKVKRQCSDEKQ